MSSEPRALLDLWRRKLAQGAGTIDLGGCGVEGTMVYWTDVLYERPDPDLAAFERGAGVGVAKSPEGHHGIRFRKSDSHQTRRWRKPDSNHRSLPETVLLLRADERGGGRPDGRGS